MFYLLGLLFSLILSVIFAALFLMAFMFLPFVGLRLMFMPKREDFCYLRGNLSNELSLLLLRDVLILLMELILIWGLLLEWSR
jgi:hypothetical protein